MRRERRTWWTKVLKRLIQNLSENGTKRKGMIFLKDRRRKAPASRRFLCSGGEYWARGEWN